MVELPAASNDPAPHSRSLPPRRSPAGAAPVRRPPPRAHHVGAALFAAVAGLAALAALVTADLRQELAPVLLPLVVLAGAAAMWGAARVDHLKLRAELGRLAEENLRLVASLETLADTAWELRESEERYRSLIDAQGDLVVRRDAAGNVTFVNPAFASAFAVAPAAVIGKPLAMVPLITPVGDVADGREVATRDIELATAPGLRWYSWVDIRMRDDDGAPGAVYSVARDITARKEVEQALVEARRKAEAASQAKSRVLATVSHEFRTPLNGILGLTGLLLETELTPDQETYARAVHSSGEALLALVDDMLDFSKIEAGRLDLRPQPTDLEALLQEIAELLAARAHVKGIDIAAEFDGALPRSVMVDAPRLRQVLINLAGNGVKFTESGGVTLSARAAGPIVGGRVTITFAVADSGPGVAPGEADRLFGEFEQVDTALSRRHGGAGLGLAISRRIVRRMGSDITVGPRSGGGSLFAFRLTLAIDGTAGAAAVAEPPVDLAGRSVLILAPAGAEPPVLAHELVAAGATVRVALTATEGAGLIGAATAAGELHEAVLIDARLAPDPATVLARVRDAAGRRVPAAVLIEPGRRGDVEALRHAGYDAYLVRPVRRSSLVRIVGEIAAATGDFRIDPGDARPRRATPHRRAPLSLEVLLAEDNEINALLARAVLEGLGHSVVEVHDGAAAVAAASERPGRFAVILMDLHMPGLDGLAAVRAIRASEAQAATPRATILALTADVLSETRAQAEAAGVDAVLEKPMTPDTLRRALADVAQAA